MTTPASTALSMTRGDNRKYTITCTLSGVALDITGGTLTWSAKRAYSDAAALITKSTTTSGIVITNAQGGIAQLTLIPADTSALGAYETLVWDVQLVLAGETYTVAQGTLTVSADVTI